MKRAQRLQMVEDVVHEQERRRAAALAASETRVNESEAKLAELHTYHASYIHDFRLRAQAGMDGARVRDYQVFLARLEEALRQQFQLVVRARAQRDSERQTWQGAAQRAEAISHMVRRFQSEEQRASERREQLESDERAHALHPGQLVPRGA
jgi:flagellar protein FliJ